MESETRSLEKIKKYRSLKNRKPNNREESVIISLLKAKVEWDYEEIFECKKNIKIALDNFILEDNVLDKIVTLSIFTTQLDELTEKLIFLFQKIDNKYYFEAKSNISKAILNYINAINNYEDFEVEKLLKNSKTDEEISIVTFLASKFYSKDKGKIEALKFSYSRCKKNLGCAKELYLLNYKIDKDSIKMLYKADSDLFYISNKAKDNDEFKKDYNFSFMPLGGGDEIGANSYLMSISGYKFIVDSGLKVGKNNVYPHYDDLKEIINSIDYVVITHAHLDHCGAMFKLYEYNNKLKFIMTKETRELTYFNFKNSRDESLDINKIGDILRLSSIILDFNEQISLHNKEIKLSLYRAGHVLGASSLLVKSRDCNVFITGDYALENQKTVEGMDIPLNQDIDILITENTYGNTSTYDTVSKKLQCESFKSYVLDKINEGKQVLIPASAIGKAQEIICNLKSLAVKNNFRIYVDGSAVEATKLYENLMKTKLVNSNIYYLRDSFYETYETKESFIRQEFMNSRACIVASSGMVQEGTTSALYAKHLLKEVNSACVLTGYQSGDTIGGEIKKQMNLDCDKYIKIDDEVYKIQSELKSFALSAHCAVDEILTLIRLINPKKVILSHGELEDNSSKLYKILEKCEFLDVYQSKNNELLEF